MFLGERLKLLAGLSVLQLAAPRVWNDLPIELRQTISMTSFKSKLKSFLFSFYIESLFTNCCHPRLRISVNRSNHYCYIFGTFGVYKIKIYLSIYVYNVYNVYNVYIKYNVYNKYIMCIMCIISIMCTISIMCIMCISIKYQCYSRLLCSRGSHTYGGGNILIVMMKLLFLLILCGEGEFTNSREGNPLTLD